MLHGPNTSDIIWSKNFTFQNLTIEEYRDGVGLNGRNISVTANHSSRFNTTIWRYNYSGPVQQQVIFKVETRAPPATNATFRFTLPSVSSGEFNLTRDGKPFKTVGNIASIVWFETDWSSHNYSLTYEDDENDTTSPDISVLHPDNNSFINSTDFFLNTSTDEDVSFMNVSIDDGQERSMSSQNSRDWYRQVSLSEGEHDAFYRANDSSNNQGTEYHVFTVDVTPPAVTVHRPRDTTLVDSTPFLNVTATEPVDNWFYSLDEGSNTSFTPNTSLSHLDDGHHTVNVWAEDRAGNLNSSTRDFAVDTTPPALDIVAPGNGSSLKGSFDVEAIWSDKISGVSDARYNITNSTGKQLSGFLNDTVDSSLLSQGSYSISYNATDTTGNTVTNLSAVTFTVDRTKPRIKINNPENTTLETSNITLNVTASESIGTWRYSLDGNSNTSFTPNASLVDLADGQHKIKVWAEDRAGNLNLSERYFTVNRTNGTSDDSTDDSDSSGGGSSDSGGSGGGGGFGSGGGTTGTKCWVDVNSSIFIDNRPANGISRVSLSTTRKVSDICLTGNRVENIPTTVKPLATSYTYYEFTKQKVPDSTISEVSIWFEVNRSFAEQFKKVTMSRWKDGWNKLDSDLLNSTGDVWTYHATAPGFSYYAIQGIPEEKAEKTVSQNSTPVCGNGVCESGENYTSCQADCRPPQKNREKSENLILILTVTVLSFLFFLAAGYYLYKLWRRKQVEYRVEQIHDRLDELRGRDIRAPQIIIRKLSTAERAIEDDEYSDAREHLGEVENMLDRL